jgi:hypothetical protein
MTYKEAIDLSVKVWRWLYDNPTKIKEDSPYWEDIKGMWGNCPLCDFYLCYHGPLCDNCILSKKRACYKKYTNTAYEYYAEFRIYNKINPDRQKQARAYIASKLRREQRRLIKVRKGKWKHDKSGKI